MKVLVTGARGMLGYDMSSAAKMAGHDVLTPSHSDMDITDIDSCRQWIVEGAPEVLVNCAAWTDVDGAEANLAGACRVNSAGIQNLAIAASQLKDSAPLIIHISSDYVFSGENPNPYLECDTTSPVNAYGSSKLLGEQLLRHCYQRHIIIRTSWLYGSHGRNFCRTILEMAGKGAPMRVVDDQTGSPTNTADLAECILRLMADKEYGTYHVTNGGSTTWHGFAELILSKAGLNNGSLTSISSDELNRPARRPTNSVLRNLALEMRGYPPMRDWTEALSDFLQRDGFRR